MICFRCQKPFQWSRDARLQGEPICKSCVEVLYGNGHNIRFLN